MKRSHYWDSITRVLIVCGWGKLFLNATHLIDINTAKSCITRYCILTDHLTTTSSLEGHLPLLLKKYQYYSNTASTLGRNLVYMTCKILVTGPDGSSAATWALIDTRSSASFITERLAQMVRLRKTKRSIEICGISGQTIKSSTTVVVQFRASPIMREGKIIVVTALILDKWFVSYQHSGQVMDTLTRDTSSWSHFWNPTTDRYHRRSRTFHWYHTSWQAVWTPSFTYCVGNWVWLGATEPVNHSLLSIAVHHAVTSPTLDTLRRFWE